MILPVLVLILSTKVVESLDSGESCTLTNGNSGVCTLFNDCESAKQQLFEGNVPDKICGYSGFDPIVCCLPSSPSSSISPVNSMAVGRGAISKQKCTEYARSVFVLREPPLLADRHQSLINVSECSIQSQALIVGGPRARPGEFPHMAAIGFDSRNGTIDWLCSGTLISEMFVLTAAHCTQSREFGTATWVRIGDTNLMKTHDGGPPNNRRIVALIRHPDFKPPAQYHDIALLRLEFRVHFNRWIRPACLHTEPSTEYPRALVTGWDSAEQNIHETSDHLLKFFFTIVDSKSCNASWASGSGNRRLPNGVVGELLVCADADGKDTCQGDSGGPLTVYSKNYCMYDVVGITSTGKLCGSKIPGLYTRLYNYIPWIESIVWGEDNLH